MGAADVSRSVMAVRSPDDVWETTFIFSFTKALADPHAQQQEDYPDHEIMVAVQFHGDPVLSRGVSAGIYRTISASNFMTRAVVTVFAQSINFDRCRPNQMDA